MGLGLLNAYQSAVGSTDPALSERAAMHEFNKARAREVQSKQALELADAEQGLLESGWQGSQRNIKATDLLEHYGSREFSNKFTRIGGNYLLGYGPNAIISSVEQTDLKNEDPSKGKIGERMYKIKVSTIEKDEDDKGFFNIRSRRNALTFGGKAEADGGEEQYLTESELNIPFDNHKIDVNEAKGISFLLQLNNIDYI